MGVWNSGGQTGTIEDDEGRAMGIAMKEPDAWPFRLDDRSPFCLDDRKCSRMAGYRAM